MLVVTSLYMWVGGKNSRPGSYWCSSTVVVKYCDTAVLWHCDNVVL